MLLPSPSFLWMAIVQIYIHGDVSHKHRARVIVDEAHATGVIGNKGQGLVQSLGLEKKVFARVITFGKALGAHGAAILCGQELRDYLINFARSFIYTTALPPHSIATIIAAYEFLTLNTSAVEKSQTTIRHLITSLNLVV